MPISNTPRTLPQPLTARYGVEALFTSPRLTRAIYQEMYGEQPPAYDASRRIKRWFFTDVLEGSADPENELCEITVYVAPTTIRSITMTKLEAATPNLPGVTAYPKYINPPESPAVIIAPSGSTVSLDGGTLVDLGKAKMVLEEINAQLGTSYTLVPGGDPWPWKIVWGPEPRRLMNITDGSNTWSAALLLTMRFRAGLGAPGRWHSLGASGPVFTADVPNAGDQDVRPEIPMPCRQLLPNERFESGFAGLITIMRTDLTQDEQGTGTGGLTIAQDKLLRAIGVAVGAK